eukprot:40845-Chlamydomonas_euryale.AAC.13
MLRSFQPRVLGLWLVDPLTILLFGITFLVTNLCTMFEAELTYTYEQDARFYLLSFSPEFNNRFASWRVRNAARCLLTAIAWLLVRAHAHAT